MKIAYSYSRCFILVMVGAVLFLSGCAQREVFRYSIPVAREQTKMSEGYVQAVHPVSPERHKRPQEAYPLEASRTQPTTSTLSSKPIAFPGPAATKQLSSSKANKLDKQLLRLQKQVADTTSIQSPGASKLRPPVTSTLSVVFSALAIVGWVALLGSSGTLSALIALLVLILSATSIAALLSVFGITTATKEPEKYNLKAAKAAVIFSILPTVILLLVLLGLFL